MGGGKGGGSNKEARRARKEEEARQRRLREGTARINEIFDGGWAPTGQVGSGASYDPNQTYFTASGERWRPDESLFPAQTAQPTYPGAFPGVGASFVQGQYVPPAAPPHTQQPYQSERFDPVLNATGGLWGSMPQRQTAAQQFSDALSGGLYTGREQTRGFDDQFFQDRRHAYLDYATPQLEQQYGDAQRDLTFALARGGLLDSSARGSRAADLQQLYDLNTQQVSDEALNYETEARNAVEDARASLIQQLNVTGDVQGAVNAARARSQALSQPPAFSPLANLFSSFTEGLGNRMAHERADMMARQYLGGNENPYTTSRGRAEVR